ncbi:ERI1 exoribonuclease 2 isoform X2 [Lontra canadensis]|uniref:ERI1 exoribonuclease 2 isoform X2 n=1 Tax=Lontra canadensis TaxID=76717 RepID=UPI0013F35142|nr:ERI1 exoribonuclease 2 isoform X2 [Lontra canadensis]
MATKKLARQLGLIRKKSVAPANGNLGRSKSKQLFDYLIVIDFESTCWNDGKRHQSQEIINADWDLGVCLEYECKRKQLIKPMFLNSWIDLRVTYKIFYRRKPKGLSGALQEVGIEFLGREHSGLDDSRNTALLAWKMIRDGCLMKITRSLNKVPTKKNSSVFTRNLNMNQVEERSACNSSIQGLSIYDREPKNTVNSHEKVQMRSVGVNSPIKVQQDQFQLKNNVKAALHNAKSYLSLFNTKSSTSVEQLPSASLNTPMQKHIRNEHLAFSTKSKSSAIGSELVLVSTTISSVNHVSDTEMSSALDCLPMLADWEDVALLPASQPEQGIDCMPSISDSNLDTSFNSIERLMVLKEGTEETPQKSGTSKSVVYKSPHTTIYHVEEAKDPDSDVSDFKLPECKSSSFNSVNATMSHPSVLGKYPHLSGSTKRNLSSPLSFPPAKKQTLIVHEEKSTSSDCSPVRNCPRKVLPSILASTVNLQEPWKSGKMTPPLCKCGRRSKRLVVSNNGPNHGKVFYCCPVGKYQENRKCCGYFKWEQTLQKERANSRVLSHSPKGLTFSSPEVSHICNRNVNFSKNSLRLRPSMRN